MDSSKNKKSSIKKNNPLGKYGSAGSSEVYFARIQHILDSRKKKNLISKYGSAGSQKGYLARVQQSLDSNKKNK